jgi:hypothetical protein
MAECFALFPVNIPHPGGDRPDMPRPRDDDFNRR